jgi:hypothetical protein
MSKRLATKETTRKVDSFLEEGFHTVRYSHSEASLSFEELRLEIRNIALRPVFSSGLYLNLCNLCNQRIRICAMKNDQASVHYRNCNLCEAILCGTSEISVQADQRLDIRGETKTTLSVAVTSARRQSPCKISTTIKTGSNIQSAALLMVGKGSGGRSFR